MGANRPGRTHERAMTAIDRAVVLLGTPIDDVTMSEAVDRIAEMVATGRMARRVHQVATINVDFVINGTQDPDLLEILQHTDLAIPDGMGVVWGARLAGVPIRERTSGVDLVPALVARAAVEGWRVCMFGAAGGVAERAAELLRATHTNADVVGLAAPAVGADGSMDAGTVDSIRAFDADVVAVALGNPKQERWIARHGMAVGAPVFIGIGGTLDFLTGVTQRAPGWVQRSGLEWVHRALSEPRRLAGRYAKDIIVYGPGLVRQAWRGRPRGPAFTPIVTDRQDVRTVRLRGRTSADVLLAAAGDANDVRADVTALDHLDNSTLAALVTLLRTTRRRGSGIKVLGISPSLDASARRLRSESLLRSPESRVAR